MGELISRGSWSCGQPPLDVRECEGCYVNAWQLKGEGKGMTSRKIISILLILLISLTACENNNWNDGLTLRAPTKVEVEKFSNLKGKVLAVRYYQDHAILLGEYFIYSLSYNKKGEQQVFGSSWGGGHEGIVKTAITEESLFVGIIIRKNIVIQEGMKLKAIFDDGTTVYTDIDHKRAHIIDHPLGRSTFISETTVQLLNADDELVYENT
jgi:hypothetical protein